MCMCVCMCVCVFRLVVEVIWKECSGQGGGTLRLVKTPAGAASNDGALLTRTDAKRGGSQRAVRHPPSLQARKTSAVYTRRSSPCSEALYESVWDINIRLQLSGACVFQTWILLSDVSIGLGTSAAVQSFAIARPFRLSSDHLRLQFYYSLPFKVSQHTQCLQSRNKAVKHHGAQDANWQAPRNGQGSSNVVQALLPLLQKTRKESTCAISK